MFENSIMPVPEDRFFDVGSIDEMKSGERRSVEIDGQPILLTKLGREFFAVRNRCTHLDYPLDGGRQIGFELVCRKHGARFDLRDGRTAGGPAVKRLTVFPVRIEGDRVMVGVPPVTADPIWPM